MINQCLHEQFVVVKKTSQFYITSYPVYLLVDCAQYKGLFLAPNPALGRELNVYDRYPKLQFLNFKDYCRVNDALIHHIIRMLGGEFERRVSNSANAYIRRFSFMFIQFLKFTYILAEGFSKKPYKLPQYPNDQLILFELS